MHQAKRKPLVFPHQTFQAGDYITDDDIAELPEKIRDRRVASLISIGRMVAVDVTPEMLAEQRKLKVVKPKRGRPKKEE